MIYAYLKSGTATEKLFKTFLNSNEIRSDKFREKEDNLNSLSWSSLTLNPFIIFWIFWSSNWINGGLKFSPDVIKVVLIFFRHSPVCKKIPPKLVFGWAVIAIKNSCWLSKIPCCSRILFKECRWSSSLWRLYRKFRLSGIIYYVMIGGH